MNENLTLVFGVGQEATNGQQTILEEYSTMDEALDGLNSRLSGDRAGRARLYIAFLYKNEDNETVEEKMFSAIDV
jgi:hypothetical protein